MTLKVVRKGFYLRMPDSLIQTHAVYQYQGRTTATVDLFVAANRIGRALRSDTGRAICCWKEVGLSQVVLQYIFNSWAHTVLTHCLPDLRCDNVTTYIDLLSMGSNLLAYCIASATGATYGIVSATGAIFCALSNVVASAH